MEVHDHAQDEQVSLSVLENNEHTVVILARQRGERKQREHRWRTKDRMIGEGFFFLRSLLKFSCFINMDLVRNYVEDHLERHVIEQIELVGQIRFKCLNEQHSFDDEMMRMVILP